MPRFLLHAFQTLPELFCGRCGLLLLVLCGLAVPDAVAKDIPVTGVLVYGPAGRLAYVQVSGFLINGKTEIRACAGMAGIDKSTYKSLPKIPLTSVKSIERLSDGSLAVEMGDAPKSCAVPGNYKFEKDSVLSAAELADRATYSGLVVGSPAGLAQMPAFATGVKIVFGSAIDIELAEYVLADRSRTIAGWQVYLTKFPAGVHETQAKSGLLTLLIASGEEKLHSYQASAASSAPSYPELKQARLWADEALQLQSGDAEAEKLRVAVRVELKAISDKAVALLQSYHDAIAAHARGYTLLVSAKDLSAQLSSVDAKYPPAAALAANIAAEERSLDSLVLTANNQIAAQQYDDAYNSITKFVSFAGEEPRVGQIVTTIYKYHSDKGNAEATSGDWKAAVVDLAKAAEIRPSDESKTALTNARAGLLSAENHAAADKASAISKERSEEKDFIAAYEILADLPDAQRALVKDQMTALQDAYLQSALARAKELQAAHTPIRGRADEDAVRQSYSYLVRCGKISDDPEIPLKTDLLADTISSYYVDLAKKYLGRPKASGVGVGWSYLAEASLFRPNLDAVRDAMTTSSAAYQMRARLTIGVEFLDQTSRRESAGFTDQMQQAFATGLESSGLPVRVILPGTTVTVAGETEKLDPNFRFDGSILQHHTTRSVKKVTLQSKYRSGSHELPNELWNKADLEFEAANLDVQKDQSALNAAQVKKNKKQTEAAEHALTLAQEKVQAARAQMNSVPKTVTEDVISTYNYTQTTLEVKNTVELTLKIKDPSGIEIGPAISVIEGDQPRKFTIVDNIKPDDTAGLTEMDSAPDELQLMADIEVEARDTLVKATHDRVQELPQVILAEARAKAATNDLDGAGELYVLYLNCSPMETAVERAEAVNFLRDRFNLHTAVNLKPSVK